MNVVLVIIVILGDTRSARAIELPLICLDVHLFPVKARVLQIARICPRPSLLLGHNWAFRVFQARLVRLSGGQMALMVLLLIDG